MKSEMKPAIEKVCQTTDNAHHNIRVWRDY